MKRFMVMLSMVAILLFAAQGFCADRDAIAKNVDAVVAAIDGGKDAMSFSADASVNDIEASVRRKIAEESYEFLFPFLAVGSAVAYLGPARVKEIIAFPTGLDTDRLSSQAILYDEKVTIVATAAQSDDVTAIAERIAQELTADEQNPAGAEETTFTSAGA